MKHLSTFSTLTTLFFVLLFGFASAQTGECTGFSTDAAEGSFTDGYNYTIVTNGTDVTITYEILDTPDGIVAFAQTLNPDFAEVPMDLVEGQTFTTTFANQTVGESFQVRVKFAFAGGLATTTYVTYVVGEGCELPPPADECAGTSTDAAEGTFTEGYNYTFNTVGTDVVATFELLDAQDGLVAFAQTYNPDFAEVPMDLVDGQTYSATFPGQTPGETFSIACKFAYAGGLSTTVIYDYVVGEGCAEPGAEIDLPITFEDPALDYGLRDFDGTTSTIVADPVDAENTVVQTVKAADAAFFAGTVVGDVVGFINPIPFSEGNTTMSVRVWSPVAPVALRLKVENTGSPGTNVETETILNTAEEWTTVTFDFANNVDGSPALDVNAVYNFAIVFFDFGNAVLDETGVAQTYYFDDILFGAPQVPEIDLPITFEDPALDYGLRDFDGTTSTIVADPVDAENTVVQTVKADDAAFFAGTVVGDVVGFINPIPFAEGNTTMSVRVWSPVAPVALRMKVENTGNPGTNVETEAILNTAEEWTTVTFDFANNVDGSPALDLNAVYNFAIVFFDFGNAVLDETGVAQTYYFDDIEFGGVIEPFTVVNVILNSPVHTILATAVQEAELVDALNAEGPFTVFAPTDDAFNALPEGALADLLEDPTGDLQEILLYHVLGAQVLEADIAAGPQTTLQGEALTIAIDGTTVTVDDATVTDTDLLADNGVVHVIDAVILPSTISLLGLEDLSTNANVDLWPNPSGDFVNLRFNDGNIVGITLSIFDLSGKVVHQTNVKDMLTRVNVSSFPAGHYIMRIDTPEGGYYQKLVVTK